MPNYIDHTGIKKSESYGYYLNNEISKYLDKRIQIERYNQKHKESPFIASGFSASISASISIATAVQVQAAISGFWWKVASYMGIAILAAAIYISMYIIYSRWINIRVMNKISPLPKDLGGPTPLSLDFFLTQEEQGDTYNQNQFKNDVVAQISSALSMIELCKAEDTTLNAKNFYFSEAYKSICLALKTLNELSGKSFFNKGEEQADTLQQSKELGSLMLDILEVIQKSWTGTNDPRLNNLNVTKSRVKTFLGVLMDINHNPTPVIP